ncbi:MAG: hypothetical protein Q7S79_01145 [bacterium]|nr:hypothetical protein [bacterium]
MSIKERKSSKYLKPIAQTSGEGVMVVLQALSPEVRAQIKKFPFGDSLERGKENLSKALVEKYRECRIKEGHYVGGMDKKIGGIKFDGDVSELIVEEYFRAQATGCFDVIFVSAESKEAFINKSQTSGHKKSKEQKFMYGIARISADVPVEFVSKQDSVENWEQGESNKGAFVRNGVVFFIKGWI